MRAWNLLGRGPPGYWTMLVIILIMLVAITYVDIFIWPNHNVALLYAVPVIFASGFESPRMTVLVTAVSAFLVVFDAFAGGTHLNVLALVLLAVLLYGYFMSRWARARR